MLLLLVLHLLHYTSSQPSTSELGPLSHSITIFSDLISLQLLYCQCLYVHPKFIKCVLCNTILLTFIPYEKWNILISPPFYKWKDWDSQSLNNFSKITWLNNDKAGIQTWKYDAKAYLFNHYVILLHIWYRMWNSITISCYIFREHVYFLTLLSFRVVIMIYIS